MPNQYYNRVTDFVPGTKVSSEEVDAEFNAVEDGFDLLGDPSLLSNGAVIWGVDAGTANNYVVDNNGILPQVAGQLVTFAPLNGNTGAAVLSLNSGVNVPIVRNDGGALATGDLIAGVPVMMIYDATNVRWMIIGATSSQVTASFRPSIREETGTAYTVTGTDEGFVLRCNNALPVTVTLPGDGEENLPVGFIVHIHQAGAGEVTLIGGAAATLVYARTPITRVQYSSLSVVKLAAGLYKVIGDQELAV